MNVRPMAFATRTPFAMTRPRLGHREGRPRGERHRSHVHGAGGRSVPRGGRAPRSAGRGCAAREDPRLARGSDQREGGDGLAPRRSLLRGRRVAHPRADGRPPRAPEGDRTRVRYRDGRAARLGAAPLRGRRRTRGLQQRRHRRGRGHRTRALDRTPRSGHGGVSSGYPIDLHTHSLRSDGALSPVELVRRAAERGVRVQALSDHDTLLGVADAIVEGERLGVRIIPTTELNTESEWGDVHVLGYFVDPADAALEDRLRWLRENRGRRIELMVEKLNALGHTVSLARVQEIAQGGALGRPHLAQALLEAGHVPTYDSAFDTLISKDSPAYVSRVGLAPLEAVALVREQGGVPSLAP